MTVYVSLQKDFYQILKPLIPDSVRLLYRSGFSLREYRKTGADFIITEVDLLEDYEIISITLTAGWYCWAVITGS